ncbi:energy-coupling factor ABC transporter ATP-binding protein [Synechococcus sp. 1G10]|uniref:energy-coupling factor ABC transporter ATP-binding protein n=1 Tax=Synechococcus sp. 1G10 TaxID=2025605 RepID=UPI000B99D391|nr:ABC transporter ATP-binding protein [Synechococcus sp. 1G10]
MSGFLVPAAIEVSQLAFTYADGTPALDGISLTIAPGESVAAMLTGLLEPAAGSIHIGGLRRGSCSLAEIRRSLGIVFQDSDDQLFMPTVAEDVAFGPVNLGLPPEALLLLDEPSANLDPRARRRLIRLLQGLAHTRLVATHDLDLVLDLCERTLVLAAGQIVADGPTDRIFVDTALLERYGLEPPLALQRCPICSRG